MIGLTDQQHAFVNHPRGAYVEACPGAGKTRAIVARVARIAATLPARRGLAVLSFTNSAVEQFVSRCHLVGLDASVRHPGFVGTFDAFLRQFFFNSEGVENFPARPIVVDSWETLDVNVRLRGRNSFRGDPVGLDHFDAESNEIDPGSVGHLGLRAHVRMNQAAYQQAAAQKRRLMLQNGYLSAADVRVSIVKRLERAEWSRCLGKALACRFHEVIVDEAQDCNPLDCRIIAWLREHRIAVTVVADPDQAIYGFRYGDPANLRAISNSFDVNDRLPLTGNFRSTPSICAFAATLRSRSNPDTCVGAFAALQIPVQLLVYQGATASDVIGRAFAGLVRTHGISAEHAIVLAHARKNALRACGFGCQEDAGGSRPAKIAAAVGRFWSSSASGRARDSAVRFIEKTILELIGKIDDGELPSRAAERRAVDTRWLRRSALELITRIPRTCPDTDDGRDAWVSSLREEVLRMRLPFAPGISPRQFFQNRGAGNWQRLLKLTPLPGMRCATIHETKGNEYEAVCVVIPPDPREPRHTERLFAAWQNRTEDEAKRVIYVGITRAKRLGVIALPILYGERLRIILEDARVNFQMISCDPRSVDRSAS